MAVREKERSRERERGEGGGEGRGGVCLCVADGSESQIAFASRTLTSSEKSYAQLEKEVVYIWSQEISSVFVWKKFILITDHQPL